MKHSALQGAEKYIKAHIRKKRWYRVVTCLACVVVFCTTYALILPAITLENTGCEIPEHTHVQECYTQVTSVSHTEPVCTIEGLNIHQHDNTCYDSEGNLICRYANFVVHRHDSACFDKDGNLWCALPEIEVHQHTDSCYTQPEVHEHTADCFTLEQWELTCVEHMHTENCYVQSQYLTCGREESEGHQHNETCMVERSEIQCGQEESAGHQHSESCMGENGEIQCGIAESRGHFHTESCMGIILEAQCGIAESEGHHHDDSCYETTQERVCEIESDHQHTDACYAWEQVLICDISTQLEASTEPVLTCREPEVILHKHTADCSDGNGYLICGMPQVLEHRHTDTCFETVQEAADTESLTCTLPEDETHTHGPLCFGTWELTCGMEEHTHTESCDFQGDGEDEVLAVALSDEDENSTTRADLSNYIGSDTVLTSAKYNPTTDQVEVSFRMTFGDMTKTGIQSANYQFTYTFPRGIIIPDNMLGKAYEGRDTTGDKGFTYQFVANDDGTYSVLVDFDETYVNKHDKFSGYINFSAYAGEDAWMEGGGYEFKFNDNCTVKVPISKIEQKEDESIHYQIAVSKSNSGYDAATNKITYTVTVDTTKGTPNPLNLTDILTAQGLEVDKVEVGSVTCVDYINQWGTTDSSTQKVITAGDSAENYQFTYNNTNGIQMTLPGLTKGNFGNGQKYTITYDVYLKEPAAGASYTVDNKVTVTGTDNSKGETVTDSAETSTAIDKTLTLQKYGSYDKATGKIRWTITVNQNGNNIAGATLTDSMFTGQTVTVSPENGYTLNGETITFSGVDGDTNTQRYTITYETDAPQVGEDETVTVENTATVTPPGGGTPIEETAQVTIDKNMKMVKTGTYDKTTDTITWSITVNENGNDIAGAELTDTMFSSVQADSITVSPSRDGMTIVSDDTTGTIQKITFSALEGATTNTQTYTITYTTLSGIDANASGTVTNTATFDPTPGTEGGEITSRPGIWVDRTVDLDKSGGWYDSSTNRIYWKIDVNKKGNNIVGYALTDNLFDQIVDGTLTIKIGGWNSVDINSTGNGFTVDKDETGKITSITFSAIGDTGANTNHYAIEYYTEAKPGWSSTTVTNTATLTPPDGTPITDEQTSSIPADGSVYKKCQGATSPDEAGNISITWRTEINVPADGLPADTVVTDTLADDGQWMDWRQIQKWGSILFANQTTGENYIQDINYWWPLDETYTILFYAKDGTTCTYDEIVRNSNGAQNKQFIKYEITFHNGVPADTYGGKTIYFEYDSYANVSGVTDEATYKNNVSVTPPDSTAKSDDASYTYKAPSVVKMDGDGKTGTTSIVTTDGSLTWKVRVRLGADCTTLTLTDNLPAGVTLTGLTFANQELTIGQDGSITGTLEGLTISSGSVTTGDDGKQAFTLTVTVPEGGTAPSYFKAQGEFYVACTCKISNTLLEAAQNTGGHYVGSFTNSVTVTADSNQFPSAEQTQEVTYTKPTSGLKLVNKDGQWVNDSRLLKYSILLNPDGMDLLTDGDTLTLTDELLNYIGDANKRFDIALLPGSVELRKAVKNEDGTWSPGEQVTDWSWNVATRVEGTLFYSTITATIPDGTPLILEYAYTCWVPAGSSFDDGSSIYYGIHNKATLSGISGGSDESKFDVAWRDSETSAGITADRAYIFYKVEKDSYGNRLPGAEFTLYDANGNALFTYTTDSEGLFIVQWQSEGSGGYQGFVHNTLYYVQETKAPEGYQLPDEPAKYYFYFSDATDTEHTLDTNMIPENAVDLSMTAYTAYVENTKIPMTEITVNKQWFSANGSEITGTKAGSVSFDLYQVASATSSGGSGGSESGGGESSGGTGVSYSYTSNSSTVVESGTLSGIQVGAVVEITVTMTYDCTYWQPTVTLTGMKAVNGGTWTHSSNSVYTHQATITAESIVVDVGDSKGKFSVMITKISDPESGNTGSGDEEETGGDTSTTPSGTLYGTYTVSNTDGWTWTKGDLPLTGTDADGNTVYYTYYVVEHGVTNCTTAYENNGGIASGTIVIKNTESENPAYTLPETGGAGTTPYTMGGLLLMAAAGFFLLYNHSKRRREDASPS